MTWQSLTFDSSGLASLTNSNVAASAVSSATEFSAAGTALAGHSGYFKQYVWVQFSVGTNTMAQLQGNLWADQIFGSDYQYVYLADITAGWGALTYVYDLSNSGAFNVVGPQPFDVSVSLLAGRTYAIELSTSWMPSSTFVGGVTSVALSVPPVPEPSTYGLALGGLALALVAVRRRAKRV